MSPAPYVSVEYQRRGIDYTSIDLSGQNGSLVLDLMEPILLPQFDLVVDAGTKEHVASLTRAFNNQLTLTKTGGLLYCANPKVGSWIDHGHHYFTLDFYTDWAPRHQCEILLLEEHSCNTSDDGWEIICLMRKL